MVDFNIPEAANDRRVVAMTIFKDRLFIATERGVYEKVGDILCRVRFEDEIETSLNKRGMKKK
jgi:hypothetical protein